MRAVVTGGAGAVGNNLVKALVPLADKITVVDDLTSGMAWTLPDEAHVEHVNGSILDDDVIEAAFAGGVTHVFHLAAFFANQNSVDHPRDDLATNILGTLRILEASRDAEVERFVYSSSSCVYGKKAGAIAEDSPYDLETPYAISKLSGEFYTRYFHDRYDLPVVTLRYFNSYGPGEPPGRYRNVIPNFIARATRGEPLTIFGTGDETRDFTFVGDTVRGTIAAAQADGVEGEIFNLGTGRQTTIRDLATLINEHFGNSGGIEYHEPRSWDHIKHRQADIGKARRELNYDPSTMLEEGLDITCRWYDAHRSELGLPASGETAATNGIEGKKLLSIVMPAYNEVQSIEITIDRVLALPLDMELIVVDDGSRDGTRELLTALKRPNLRVILHEANRGKGAAVRTGFEAAKGHFVTIQDADLELDPDQIPGLLEPLLDDEADVVYGSRFVHGYKHMRRISAFANWFLTKFTNVLYGINITDMEACYKVFPSELVPKLALKGERFDFEAETTAKFARLGLRIVERPVTYKPRHFFQGKKIQWRDGVEAIWTLLKYRFVW